MPLRGWCDATPYSGTWELPSSAYTSVSGIAGALLVSGGTARLSVCAMHRQATNTATPFMLVTMDACWRDSIYILLCKTDQQNDTNYPAYNS